MVPTFAGTRILGLVILVFSCVADTGSTFDSGTLNEFEQRFEAKQQRTDAQLQQQLDAQQQRLESQFQQQLDAQQQRLESQFQQQLDAQQQQIQELQNENARLNCGIDTKRYESTPR
jgi:uncharacterized protein HemX